MHSVFHQSLSHITLVFHHSTPSLPSQYLQSSTTVHSVFHHSILSLASHYTRPSIRSSITVYWNHQIHSVLQGTDENWQKVNRTVLTGVYIDRSLFVFFLSFFLRTPLVGFVPNVSPKYTAFLHSTLIPPVHIVPQYTYSSVTSHSIISVHMATRH